MNHPYDPITDERTSMYTHMSCCYTRLEPGKELRIAHDPFTPSMLNRRLGAFQLRTIKPLMYVNGPACMGSSKRNTTVTMAFHFIASVLLTGSLSYRYNSPAFIWIRKGPCSLSTTQVKAIIIGINPE